MDITQHDDKRMHCRMLGHEITFAYCRQTAGAQPCRKVLDCWFETFDVEAFARQHFTAEQISAIVSPPKPKMASIIELIEQAKRSMQA